MEDIQAPAPHIGAPAELRLALKVTGGNHQPCSVDLEVPPEDLTRWLAGEACLPDAALEQLMEVLFNSITGEAPR
jgi:hypothetical protein